jgi:HlyD family type I secretion membrane fusion protein
MSRSVSGSKPRENSFGLGSRVIVGAILVLALAGGCGAWAATSSLSGAIIAPGVLRVTQHLKELQHRDGGTVAEIAVRAGDTVTKGQVLIRLDDVQIRSERQIVRSELSELQARTARLSAERDMLPAIAFPADTPAEIVQGESRLFDGNRLGLQRRTEQLELQIGQIDQERTALEAQLAALDDEVLLIEKERERMRDLTERKLVETGKVNTLDRELTRMHGQRGEIEANIARANGKASEVRLQIIAVAETARNEAQRDIRALDGRIAELTERLAAVEDRLSRIEIRAPIGGTINEFNVHTIGGVISPAETFATIVPDDSALTVEVKLATKDVDQLFVGQPAKLHFTAFNQRTTPEMHGELTRIAAAATQDRSTGQYYYLAELAISDHTQLGGRPLRPGMPVDVFIQTEERTAMSYLLKPFTDQVNRAFREE